MAEPVPLRPKRLCPICRRSSQRATHPFCSSRCAQIDLNRWLGGQYAIAAQEGPEASTPEDDNGQA